MVATWGGGEQVSSDSSHLSRETREIDGLARAVSGDHSDHVDAVPRVQLSLHPLEGGGVGRRESDVGHKAHLRHA